VLGDVEEMVKNGNDERKEKLGIVEERALVLNKLR
jgi:hypothetical protein